nr:ribonuclease H-like domain-containing protein [Tanacetum cinerariifolium]
MSPGKVIPGDKSPGIPMICRRGKWQMLLCHQLLPTMPINLISMQSSAQPQAQQQQAKITSTSPHQPAQQPIYQVIGPLQPMYPADSNFYVPENYAYMPNALHCQATMVPQAFQTMTPQDPSWNMDTGASSQLADNTDNQTQKLLLCCDSTGYLHPVTHPPSPSTPSALLSFSHSTWHRRLGHPGDNVTSHLISCNKSKSSSSCHACQLANVNVVRSMWLFKHKFHTDGSLSRYKDRLVVNGRSQQQGIDCDETFSSVVKPATIHTVLSLAVSHDWPIHHLDVKKAFLYVHLSETVYMHQPPEFVDYARPDYARYGGTKAPLRREAWLPHYETDQVDNIILTALSTSFLQRIIGSLHGEFAMTILGSLNYFLGLLVQQVYLYMHDPRKHHLVALKRISRLPSHPRSTSGYCIFLEYNILSWFAKRWVTISRSSAEAEYHGVANVVAETALIRNLLLELHAPLHSVTLVYCDNVSTIYLSTKSVQHQRTKHIEIDIHFVCDYVASRQVHVLHLSSRFQYADIFTKGLLSALFLKFHSSLNVLTPHILTAREY